MTSMTRLGSISAGSSWGSILLTSIRWKRAVVLLATATVGTTAPNTSAITVRAAKTRRLIRLLRRFFFVSGSRVSQTRRLAVTSIQAVEKAPYGTDKHRTA